MLSREKYPLQQVHLKNAGGRISRVGKFLGDYGTRK